MHHNKRIHPKVKSSLHKRNKHRNRYDFKQLVSSCPELNQYLIINKYQDESVDFFNPDAVKMLNKALLQHYYGIEYWDIPRNYLCPPIPGRADYIHHIADLLFQSNPELHKPFKQNSVRCLDIGVGANCVYPIIGVKEYGWSFVGTDIDSVSITTAQKIIDNNPILNQKVELRLQKNSSDIFQGIIKKDEHFDLSICNPPFHSSAKEAQLGTVRKLRNLKREKIASPILNFGGQNNELWCVGGEAKFVDQMIQQSKNFSNSCNWFSTLISKQSNLEGAYHTLKENGACDIKTIEMGQGNKVSRILAWRFLDKETQGNRKI